MGAKSRSNCLHDAFWASQDIIVPEAQNAPSPAAQIGVARPIPAGFCVLAPIRLDDKTSFDTDEIDNIRRDRVLPPETPAELVIS